MASRAVRFESRLHVAPDLIIRDLTLKWILTRRSSGPAIAPAAQPDVSGVDFIGRPNAEHEWTRK